MTEKNETVQFLGQDLQVVKKSDGSEKLVMKKASFDQIMAEKGVTKEVRDVITNAHNEIASAALKFEADRLLALNKGKKETDADYTKHGTMVLGSGSGSMEIDVQPHRIHNGKDIQTGEPYTTHKYGVCSVQINYALAQEVKKEGGLIDTIANDFRKALGAKK